MISTEETQYLFWITSALWDGRGDVLEVGPWLGGSTWYLADGMDANPRRRADSRLHVIDNFRWRPFMSERSDIRLEPDASFRSCFERNVAPKQHLIVIHEASLPDDDSAVLADPGGVRTGDAGVPQFSGEVLVSPIAIAFVDGAKSWSALRHLLHELAPRIVPGRTILAFQDFQAALAYWVPMAVGLLLRTCPDSLMPLHVLQANTVSFRIEREIPQHAIAGFPKTIAEMRVADGLRLLDDTADLLRRRGDLVAASTVGLSSVAFLGTKGEWQAARSKFRRVEADWPWQGSSLNQLTAIRRWIAQEQGSTIVPSRRARALVLYLRVRNGLSRRLLRR
ncbi:MAG: hypothetical protein WKF96_06925 [Solirubrobacteraceae bacterium]